MPSNSTVSVMRGSEVLALAVSREYAALRVADNNRVWEPARIVNDAEAIAALRNLLQLSQ